MNRPLWWRRIFGGCTCPPCPCGCDSQPAEVLLPGAPMWDAESGGRRNEGTTE